MVCLRCTIDVQRPLHLLQDPLGKIKVLWVTSALEKALQYSHQHTLPPITPFDSLTGGDVAYRVRYVLSAPPVAIPLGQSPFELFFTVFGSILDNSVALDIIRHSPAGH